jgi:hypothetical protein
MFSIVKNNLGYAPRFGGVQMLQDGGTGTVASNNSTDTQMRTADPGFRAMPPRVAADFKPRCTTAYPCALGTPVPVWSDYRLLPQPTPRDLGAVNRGESR